MTEPIEQAKILNIRKPDAGMFLNGSVDIHIEGCYFVRDYFDKLVMDYPALFSLEVIK